VSIGEVIGEFILKLQNEVAYGDPVVSIELTPAAYQAVAYEASQKMKYLNRFSFEESQRLIFMGVEIRSSK
jgi:hypothetical protein